MKRFHLTTFGCQMNEHDSERMKGMLTSIGYEETAGRDEADLILFNTCSIRENADNRFISHLGEAKRLKTENPDRIVGVGGCLLPAVDIAVDSQRHDVGPGERVANLHGLHRAIAYGPCDLPDLV